LLGCLGLGTHQTNFILELNLPSVDVTIVKDDCISCCPYDPVGCYENFSEDSTAKVCSSLKNQIQRTKVQIPVDWYCEPAGFAKSTFKEKVKVGFFTT
jgi:rubredoxin